MFRHHPDGFVFLNGDRYPLEWFVRQEPAYRLPPGAIGRDYLPGVRHTLYSGDSQYGGEMPWEEGDRYLAMADQYRTNWEADQAATTLQQAPPLLPALNQPDWGKFRMGLLQSPGYNRVANSCTNPVMVSRLETVAINNPGDMSLVAFLWAEVIRNSQPFTPEEIGQLQTLAKSCKMQFRFTSEGRMQPLQPPS